MGDGVRSVPLSFKVTVKVFQVVCQAQVVNGVGDFSLIVICLSLFQTEPALFPGSLSDYTCLASLTSLLNVHFTTKRFFLLQP